MSRRHAAKKRNLLADVKFNSVLLSKFNNKIMKNGNKHLAEKIVYNALDKIEKKHKTNAFDIFISALNNVRPHLEVTSIRIGGANYQVPAPVTESRGHTLAIKWIINSATKRSERSMSDKLAEEIFEAANNRGASIKKRDDTHKMAEANKAYAHFSTKKYKGH